MPQRDLAGVAQKQVEPHHQQGVDADEVEEGVVVVLVHEEGDGSRHHGEEEPAV